MQKIEIKQHLIPIYLAIILLILIESDIATYLIALSPILLISISIQIKNKKLGFLGFFLFYTLSLSSLYVYTMEDFGNVLIYTVLLLIPGLMLLNQILQIENKIIIWYQKEKTTTLLIPLIILVLIITIFYLITIFFTEGIILSSGNLHAQIMILGALSLLFCTPLIIRS